MIQKDYISKNHSKFLIKYHVIFVCKYRKKLLIGAVEYKKGGSENFPPPFFYIPISAALRLTLGANAQILFLSRSNA